MRESHKLLLSREVRYTVQGAGPQGFESTGTGGTSVLVTYGAPVASSPSTSLWIPLVHSLHGTSADTGTGASTGSSRTGVGTSTPGSVGRPSSSPD